MALRDVKNYYFKMLAQYMEMKSDLADFEQALKDGFITEEQLQTAFEEVNKVQQNYERLSYIIYLFNLPNRKSKRKKLTLHLRRSLKTVKRILRQFQLKTATRLEHLKMK